MLQLRPLCCLAAIDRRLVDAAHMVMAAGAPVKSNDDDVEALRRAAADGDGQVPVARVIPTLWGALGRGRWEGGRELVAGGATVHVSELEPWSDGVVVVRCGWRASRCETRAVVARCVKCECERKSTRDVRQ